MKGVWGFPNKLGANGGGAFLVAYLVFVALFGSVALPTEFAMGRWAGTGTLGTYGNRGLRKKRQTRPPCLPSA